MTESTEQVDAITERAQASDPHLRPLESRPLREVHHGQTGAMWTAVVIELVGFLLGGIAVLLGPNWTLFVIAAAICVIGIGVGIVMQKLGYGIYQKQQES
ncbi:HGxxPAAW family protein [Microlunatus sp. Gsoil 973]|jgi:hypothetical protein|uniref:HGxxPAAW family protein n=1 Tax=Microlunatus sp. Gsoil 973 TaxID=2672569 RepID=UPI0012B4594F|nr:HGxxPAAW family protein [Microlunatus sp. Gsoil 973]QGN32377.1 hypothetical protein GJV80_05740 [Microlunatus sp. Gsoil 973]